MRLALSRHLPESTTSCAVTVIVAAYNTGDPLRELVRSLDDQTMAQERFEVIVVDDGSTDGTGDALDALAASRRNWIVRHIPNSGWPGTPRNVGLDLARGEFVTFVDHDDYLGSQALQTAFAFGRENASDVVVAREVGVGRSIGRFMFARSVPNATFENSPILRLLTPHKMYRREMLRENGIRFPEGKVRLEDHLFTMSAYFAARRISIYADHPFYYWTRREGTAHASLDLKDPHEYVEVALNAVLDVVDAHVAPGPRRDRIKSHWLERKLLPIVARAPMLEYPAAYRVEMVRVARALVVRRYPPSADIHLHFSARVRAHLLRAGHVDALMALARTEQEITTRAQASQVTWHDAGADVRLRVELLHRDGTPVEFAREDGRLYWVPGERLDDPTLDLDVTGEIESVSVLLVVQRRDGLDEFTVEVSGSAELHPVGDEGRTRLVFEGVAPIPVHRMMALRSGESRSVLDLRTELEVLGWRSVRRVADGADLVTPLPWSSTSAGDVTLYRTIKGNVSLRIAAAPESMDPSVRPDGMQRPAVGVRAGRRVVRRGLVAARSLRDRLSERRTR